MSILAGPPLVLAYHAIGDVDPRADAHSLFTPVRAFARQMTLLASRRRVVPLERVVDGTAPRGSVALTFDDGYRSVLEHAVPVLEHLGLPSTMFMPTAFVGDRNRWNGPTGLDLSIMSVGEMQECERRGMRIESHGHAHLDMRTTTPEDARADLVRSREVLAEHLGRMPELLAWPFRTGSPAAQEVARGIGFRKAFSIDVLGDGPFAHPRVQISPQDGAPLFWLKTTGRYLQLRHSPAADKAYQRSVKPLLKGRWTERR